MVFVLCVKLFYVVFNYDGFNNFFVLFIVRNWRMDGCWYNSVVVFEYYLVDFIWFFFIYFGSIVYCCLLWVYYVKYFYVFGFFLCCFNFVLLYCCFVILLDVNFIVWMGGKIGLYVIRMDYNIRKEEIDRDKVEIFSKWYYY